VQAEAIIAKMKAQESEGADGASTLSDDRTPLLITSDQVIHHLILEGHCRSPTTIM